MIAAPPRDSVLAQIARKRLGELARAMEAGSHYAKYANDPIGFIEGELGERLTDQQKAIAFSVTRNRETNVQAAHGVGKSHLSSRLVVWWVLAVGGLAITTAPTARQVNQILWSEIRRLHAKLKLPGDLGQTFFRITESARAFGFTAAAGNSNAFQGIHNDRLLVILDEACGISPEIDEGAGACATGENNRILRVGNPITPDTPFQSACARRNIRIPVWDHPNCKWAYELHSDGVHRLKADVVDAIYDGDRNELLPPSQWPDWCGREVIPGAVSIAWIEDARAKYGEGSAYWLSRVEGIFPVDSEASIIPRSWFAAARARYDADPAHWDAQAAAHKNRWGLDVGDGGDDHAIARWQGPVLYSCKAIPTKGDMEDVTRAAGMAIAALKEYPGSMNVDRGGCGAAVPGLLKEQGCSVNGIHWGEGARDSAQYLNSKAEDFWTLREALQKGQVAIAPLGEYEEMAIADLSGICWEQTSTGKIRIEDKAKTRKRLHRSPNVGDAIVMGFRQPPARGIKRSGVQLY